MNKLFTKVAALTLGVAMAAGVGVAVGASQKAESVFADNVTFTAGTDTSTTLSISKDGFTITLSNGTLSRTDNYRVYQGATMTITSTVGAITQINFDGTGCDSSKNPSQLSTTTGTYDNSKYVWTGEANEIVFSSPSKQSQIAAISITYTPSVEPGIFLEPSSLLLVDTGASKDVTITTKNFSADPVITLATTPTHVDVALSAGKATFTPKSVGDEKVRINAVNGTESAYAEIDVSVKDKHGRLQNDPFTVAEAKSAIDDGITAEDKVYVTGIVSQIDTTASEFSGQIIYWISADGTTSDQLEIYWGRGLDNKNFDNLTDIELGASVVNYGSLKKHNSTYEFDSGSYLVSYQAPTGTKYHVSFDHGQGSGTMEAVEVLEGNTYTLPKCTFTAPEGQVFDQWTLDGVPVTEVTVTSDVTVVATWKDAPNTKNDTIDRAFTGVEGTTYTAWGPTAGANSGAEYAGLSSGGNSSVQLRSDVSDTKPASGVVSTVSGGNIYSVSIEFESHTVDGRTIDVFGSNSAYESPADLVDNNKKGTLLGSIVCGTSTDLEVSGEYTYVGIRSNSGAAYLASITFAWEQEAPVPTAWTTEQEQTFKDNLDGYVPPYFAELSGEIEVSGTLVQYNVKSDVVAAFNSYYEQQGWESEVAGYWSHETTGGNGVVQAYAQTSATGALLSFQYTEYAVVTLDENGTKTEVKLVPPADYTLPSPTASLIPDGKEFKAWEIAGVEYQPEAKVSVSEDVTITAVYVDKAQTEWTDAQKTALETALHGYVPPFFGELVEEITTTENSARFTVSGDHSAEFATKLGDGWESAGTNNYVKKGDNYYLTASIYVEGVRLPVGDYSYFTFTYGEGEPPATDWSDEFKAKWTARFVDSQGTVAGLPPFIGSEICADENIQWHQSYPYADMDFVDSDGSIFTTIDDTIYGSDWLYAGELNGGYGYIYCDPTQTAYAVTYRYQDTSGNLHSGVTFEVIAGIVVETADAKTEYFVGDTLDLTGLVVHFALLDRSWANTEAFVIPNDYLTPDKTVLDTAGEVTITLDIAEVYTATYKVTVQEVVPTSLVVSGTPTKTEYEAGENWSAEGLVVTAHYNNGTEADVTDQVTWSFDPAETAAEVTSVSAVAHLGDLSSDAFAFDVVVEQSYDADAFAKDLLEMVAPICNNYDGKKNNKAALKTVWDTMSQRYSTLSNEEKAKVVAAAAKADGTDLEKAMAFYNYACKKYGLTKFIEGRQVKALVAEHETGNSILPIVVIVASSVAAITAIGVVIALKRRKALLAK